MGNLLEFKRPSPQEKNRGKTLCRSGLHKWEVVKQTPFDVKSGRLVTLLRCTRCGTTRNETR